MKNHPPNGVGVMDGILIQMGIDPSCFDAFDYQGRKM